MGNNNSELNILANNLARWKSLPPTARPKLLVQTSQALESQGIHITLGTDVLSATPATGLAGLVGHHHLTLDLVRVALCIAITIKKDTPASLDLTSFRGESESGLTSAKVSNRLVLQKASLAASPSSSVVDEATIRNQCIGKLIKEAEAFPSVGLCTPEELRSYINVAKQLLAVIRWFKNEASAEHPFEKVSLEISTMDHLGKALILTGEEICVKEGITHLSAVLAIYRERFELEQEAFAHRYLAIGFAELKNLEAIRTHYQQAREMFERLNKQGGKDYKSFIASMLLTIAPKIIKFGTADNLVELLIENRQVDKLKNVALNFYSRGYSLIEKGQRDKGLAYLKTALQLFEKLEDKEQQAATLNRIAKGLPKDVDHWEEVAAARKRAAELYEAIGNTVEAAINYSFAGKAFLSCSKLESAAECRLTAARFYGQAGDINEQWQNLILAGATSVNAKVQASNQLEGTLSRLLAIAENYPQLRASENFRALQDELAGTENRIAVARMRYNEAVQKYNTAARSFPTVVWVRMFGFDSEKPFFKVGNEAAKEAPKVVF